MNGRVGAGGMGTVYRATDRLLGRTVAIKSVRRDFLTAAENVPNLRNEARAVAALNHPAIAAVHDLIESDEGGFIVMEYVYGDNLWRVIRSGHGVSPLESMALLCEILDALAHAHESGVINCDIKPGNVMLTPDGKVKVLDFGVASLVAEPRHGVHGLEGNLVGTASYIPPEAIRGEAPNVQRDLYGAGVTLYELLTGLPPFHGMNTFEIFHATTSLPVPPPSSLNPLLDSTCDAVLLKALALDPADRFQQAGEMKAALDSISWSPSIFEGPTNAPDGNPLHPDTLADRTHGRDV